MRISKHISLREATHSATAKRRGIENTPNEEQLDAMYKVAEFIFEPLRLYVGGAIKINSFFRSPKVIACAAISAAIDFKDVITAWPMS